MPYCHPKPHLQDEIGELLAKEPHTEGGGGGSPAAGWSAGRSSGGGAAASRLRAAVRVHPALEGDFTTWRGASVLAGTSTFAEHWCVHAPTHAGPAPWAPDDDDYGSDDEDGDEPYDDDDSDDEYVDADEEGDDDDEDEEEAEVEEEKGGEEEGEEQHEEATQA